MTEPESVTTKYEINGNMLGGEMIVLAIALIICALLYFGSNNAKYNSAKIIQLENGCLISLEKQK